MVDTERLLDYIPHELGFSPTLAPIRRRPAIRFPGDEHEREADKVMRMGVV